jgi:hypothetical protein
MKVFKLYLQWGSWVIGLGLQYLVTLALLSGSFREFPVIFGYLLCLIVTTVTDILIFLDFGQLGRFNTYYWTADLLRETAMYAVVISLIVKVMPDNQRRASLLQLLLLSSVLLWVGSIIVYHDPKITIWMVRVVRNLSFCSSVSTLILWFVLIASEKRDARLLVITGGLGLQMTGEAIGQSLLQIGRSTVIPGYLVMVLSHFLCLVIWWRAFRTPSERDLPLGNGVPV